MLNRPKNSFKKSAAAALIAGVITLPFAANANNVQKISGAPAPQCTEFEAPAQKSFLVEAGSNMNIATRASEKWSECNKDGMSVTLYLGTHKKTPSMQRAEEFLSDIIEKEGVNNYAFFFAKNDVEGSYATIQRRGETIAHGSIGKIIKEATGIAENLAWENGKIATTQKPVITEENATIAMVVR